MQQNVFNSNANRTKVKKLTKGQAAQMRFLAHVKKLVKKAATA